MDRHKLLSTVRILLTLILLISLTPLEKAAATPTAQTEPPNYPIFAPMIFTNFNPQNSVMGVETTDNNLNNISTLASAGNAWIRRNAVMWAQVEPAEGQRLWDTQSGLDTYLAAAAARGAHVILIVRYAPTWARQDASSNCGPVKPDKLPAFASFMHDVVARYSAQPYNVRYFEVWNEPDVYLNSGSEPYGCWGNTADPYYGGQVYGNMLKAVYPQMKAANPEAQVVIGGLLMDCDVNNPPPDPSGTGLKDCHSARYLEGIVRAGAAPYFDIVSFHAYDYYMQANHQYSNSNWHAAWNTTGPVMVNKIAFLRTTMQSLGISNKPLIDTEVALICALPAGQACDAGFESTKADYLVISYAETLKAKLPIAIWYDATGAWRSSGLLTASGEPLPGYLAFRTATLKLGHAVFETDMSSAGMKIYAFRSLRGRVWVAWSGDGQNHAYTLPSLPAAQWSSTGEQLTNSTTVNLTPSPVFIEWAN